MKSFTAPQWSKLLTSLIASYLAGFVGSLFMTPESMAWYATLYKPFFSPPSWVFGPVWMILYACIGVALYRLWSIRSREGKIARSILWIHLVFNASWTALFFGYGLMWWALACLALLFVMIFLVIIDARKFDITTAWLLVPYVLWLAFAFALNLSAALNNPYIEGVTQIFPR
jgi:tryptophan-rich sensory protein